MNMKPIRSMAEMAAAGESPEILFWVGCAGSFDARAIKITKAFTKILQHLDINFAVLGKEEGCTGDPAKRAGNELAFQMAAHTNIEILNMYAVKKIVTTCPHCFNILKNEYAGLGGHYEVLHHSQYLQELIEAGKVVLKDGGSFKGKRITFHDSCYMGRANDVYEAPREVIALLDAELVEMKKSKKNGMCCGAGGAQMFKEDEPGKQRINTLRTEQAMETQPDIIAVSCPFCMTMMTDGVKGQEMQEKVKVLDLAEMIAMGQGLESIL
jgi:heterodisulfide reductase subunit D